MNVEDIRRRLEERLAGLTARLTRIDADLRDPGSKDWQERASESENDEVLERLGDSDRAELAEIRSALDRIRRGTYQTCTRCGGPIALARLEALPHTSLCVSCAR